MPSLHGCGLISALSKDAHFMNSDAHSSGAVDNPTTVASVKNAGRVFLHSKRTSVTVNEVGAWLDSDDGCDCRVVARAVQGTGFIFGSG